MEGREGSGLLCDESKTLHLCSFSQNTSLSISVCPCMIVGFIFIPLSSDSKWSISLASSHFTSANLGSAEPCGKFKLCNSWIPRGSFQLSYLFHALLTHDLSGIPIALPPKRGPSSFLPLPKYLINICSSLQHSCCVYAVCYQSTNMST